MWKTITGFEKYEVSDEGLVRNAKTKRILKPSTTTHGYKQVLLTKEPRKLYSRQVHKLVLDAFSPENVKRSKYIIHKDGNKTNNRLSNLEYLDENKYKIEYIPIDVLRNLERKICSFIRIQLEDWYKENIKQNEGESDIQTE